MLASKASSMVLVQKVPREQWSPGIFVAKNRIAFRRCNFQHPYDIVLPSQRYSCNRHHNYPQHLKLIAAIATDVVAQSADNYPSTAANLAPDKLSRTDFPPDLIGWEAKAVCRNFQSIPNKN
jgi:hypothetical protein